MNMKNEMIPAGISGLLNQVPQNGLLLNIVEGSGCFIRHSREGGHPIYWVPNFLDSCLRRNDGMYRRKLSGCSNIVNAIHSMAIPFKPLYFLSSVLRPLTSVTWKRIRRWRNT